MTINKRTLFVLTSATLLLAACELPFLGGEEARIEAKREAEGRAVGGACRHSGRALEECYGMNPKTSKAAIYAGWRDMDGYMRENNIQIVSPEGAEPPAGKPPEAEAKPKAAEVPTEAPKAAEAPGNKAKAAETNPAEARKAAAAPADVTTKPAPRRGKLIRPIA